MTEGLPHQTPPLGVPAICERMGGMGREERGGEGERGGGRGVHAADCSVYSKECAQC